MNKKGNPNIVEAGKATQYTSGCQAAIENGSKGGTIRAENEAAAKRILEKTDRFLAGEDVGEGMPREDVLIGIYYKILKGELQGNKIEAGKELLKMAGAKVDQTDINVGIKQTPAELLNEIAKKLKK